MRDGVVLSAALYLPQTNGTYPAILDAVPYRKDDDFLWIDWDTYGFLATQGFGCVRLDLRGTGSSEGILSGTYEPQELDDLEDTIAAIASMDWCTGRVGMTGVSWGGFNCMQVAMRRPPALGAVVPIHWSADRYNCDVHYYGGTMKPLDSVDWQGSMIVENALPPHRGLVGEEAFERIWKDRLEHTPQWPINWLHRQRRDAHWKHGSLCEDWGSLDCAVLAIGGWQDGYRDACLDLIEHATVPRRAIIGPWGHTRPHNGWPAPAIDARLVMARWFKRFLADEPNGVDQEPVLTAFVMDGIPRAPIGDAALPGRWRSFRIARSMLSTELEIGPRLHPDGVQTVGASMPWWCGAGAAIGYGGSMALDDEHCYTVDLGPLEQPLTLLGKPRLSLRLSADQPVALVTARLEHVHADGYSAFITRGALNLTQRESQEFPTPLVPGEPVDVSFDLMSFAVTIPAGDTLRLALANADFPLCWPSPQRTDLTFLGGRLTIPLADETAEVDPPELPAPGEPFTNPVTYEDVPESFAIVSDRLAKTVRVETTTGWSAGLPDGGRSEGTAQIFAEVGEHDPLSCVAEAKHTASVTNDGIRAVARSRFRIGCDADAFHLEIDLTVERDGKPFFERSWRESAARDLM